MPIKVNQQGKKNSQRIFVTNKKMQTNADINMSNQPTPQSTTALVEIHNDHEATGLAPIQGFDGDEHPLLMESVAKYRIENSVHDFDMSSLDYKKSTHHEEECQIEIVPQVNDSASRAEAVIKTQQSIASRLESTLYVMIIITVTIDIVWLIGVALFILFAVLAILQGGYLSAGYAIGLGISGTIVLVSFIAAVAVLVVGKFQFEEDVIEMNRSCKLSTIPEYSKNLRAKFAWFVLIMVNLPLIVSIMCCCVLAVLFLRGSGGSGISLQQ